MPEAANLDPAGNDPTIPLINELSATMVGPENGVNSEETGLRPRISHSLAGAVLAIESGYAPPRCPRPVTGRRHTPEEPIAPAIADFAPNIARIANNPMLSLMDSILGGLPIGSSSYNSIQRADLAKELMTSVLDRYGITPLAEGENLADAEVSFRMGSSVVSAQHIGGGIKVTTWDNRLTIAERKRIQQEYMDAVRRGLGLVQLHHFAHNGTPDHFASLRETVTRDAPQIDTSFAEYSRRLREFTDSVGFRQVRLFGDTRHCLPVALHILSRPPVESDDVAATHSLAGGTLTVTGPGRFAAMHTPSLQWRIGEDGGLQRIASER